MDLLFWIIAISLGWAALMFAVEKLTVWDYARKNGPWWAERGALAAAEGNSRFITTEKWIQKWYDKGYYGTLSEKGETK